MRDLERLIAGGESETLELKRSTALLTRAGETLCAFLNSDGGQVVIGAADDGRIVGQEVSDKTRREIAAMLDRFEPPAPVDVDIVALPERDRKVIVLTARPQGEADRSPCDGRPYQRVQTTTSVMPQERYEAMLLERAHARRRWENQPAVDVRLEDLDHEEILLTREAAIQKRRLSAGTPADVGDILDRLGLRRGGVITQAAQVLYGTRFLPDYPQGLLKLGRFRGTKITGDILDNRQEHLHAFAIVREAIAFLDRTLPLAAHFTEGRIARDDRLPVPPDALREILLNAVMHRDYTDPSGYVAVAVFDDRIEIRSLGRLPRGITPESLAGPHLSIPRNPLIAETFHRTGAVEIWGRGTNRVIEECRRYGLEAPTFDEQAGAVVVTFRAAIGPAGPEVREREQVSVETGLTRRQAEVLRAAGLPARAAAILALLNEHRQLGSAEILRRLGATTKRRALQAELRRLQDAGLVVAAGRGRAMSYGPAEEP
jgi:ATP-dependent DNA helicase RecG